jgi:hypothetical protein
MMSPLLESTSKHDDFKPFFIVGCPRSGTTLLSVLLDRHSSVSVPPETFFFHVFSGVSRQREKPDYEWLVSQYLDDSYMSAMKLDRSKILQRLCEYNPDHASFFRCALEEYAAGQNKSIIGEKTATHLMWIDTIFQWYPNAKIVWIVRDGRDVVMAMMRLFHKNLRAHCSTWRMSVELGLIFQQKYPDKLYQIRFEDLVINTKAELIKLGNFLGIDYQERMLDTNIYSGAVPENERFYKERALQPIDRSRISEWKRSATPQQIHLMHSVMGNSLEKLGYKNDFDYGSNLDRIQNAIVQIPFNLAFNNRVHPQLQSYRLRLRSLVANLKG